MEHILIICLLVSWFVYVMSFSGAIVASGQWKVLNVKECPNKHLYPIKVDIKRRKLNRTHDGFDMHLELDEPIDSEYAVRLDICKYVDGGCKPYQVIADDSFEHLITEYALDNMIKIFTSLGMDPPAFPMPAGEHELSGYVFDYTELPEDGVIGTFGIFGYLIKDNRENACLDVKIEFTPEETGYE